MRDEDRYRILKLLASNSNMNQRQLAVELGISLGKANYCIKALVEKGLVKANNFRNSQNKGAYAYFLTRKGIEEKAKITLRFLKHKQKEYVKLQQELEMLREEAVALTRQKPE